MKDKYRLIQNFSKVYDGAKVRPARALSCSNFVNSKMEYAVGRIYISKFFNSNSKYDVKLEII